MEIIDVQVEESEWYFDLFLISILENNELNLVSAPNTDYRAFDNFPLPVIQEIIEGHIEYYPP